MKTSTVLSLIGHTPLIGLKEATGLSIYAKAEFLNPGGSIKDRIALAMIEAAEASGDLKPGMIIIEPTSGNTGIGISLVGVRKGYKVIIVMPENMSEERKKIIKALGAELILTPAKLSIGGSVDEVERISSSSNQYFVPHQFKNKANPECHYLTTAKELYEQLDEHIDIFISGLGSGGTLQGIGSYLKNKNPNVKIVAVEPKGVSAILGHPPGIHAIQGIGDGFIPQILNTSLIDDVVEVSDEDALNSTIELASDHGLLVGISSGANLFAAKQMAKKYGKDKVIATIFADRMERYFSTNLFK